MPDDKFFLTQIQKKGETYTKGVSVHDSLDSARQAYHAYLGAYGFGHDASVDYVACYICDMSGYVSDICVDDRRSESS